MLVSVMLRVHVMIPYCYKGCTLSASMQCSKDHYQLSNLFRLGGEGSEWLFQILNRTEWGDSCGRGNEAQRDLHVMYSYATDS